MSQRSQSPTASLEVQDKDAHLFGFERMHALLQHPATAAQIAAAAQNFGLQDDIRFLSVTLIADLQGAAA
ncbi:MAG: hypothetical protein ACP5E5_15345 [Acidobacteriaceae bacterium]